MKKIVAGLAWLGEWYLRVLLFIPACIFMPLLKAVIGFDPEEKDAEGDPERRAA